MFWVLALVSLLVSATVTTTAAGLLQAGRTHIFLITDPHGVYSGHPRPKVTADYPALTSFVDSLREQARGLENCKVYFFENGDLVDGGGLTSVPEGKRLMFPLLAQIGFDARTMGNHELYDAATVETMQLPGDFVTSNIVWRHRPDEPLGHRYRVIDGNVLVLGFLYDMTNFDPKLVEVNKVEECVQAEWFRKVVTRTDLTAIVVLAHMDYNHPLVMVIFQAIRKLRMARNGQVDKTPLVIATGHTHQRRHKFFDERAISLEAGKFVDTIGLVSFRNDGRDLTYSYVDPDHAQLLKWSNGARQDSAKAQRLRQEIQAVRDKLGLDRVVGRTEVTYTRQAIVGASNSIISFWVDRVIQYGLFAAGARLSNKLFFVGGTGTVRYDLFKGDVTVDDLWVVSPFADPFYVIRNVPGRLILLLVSPVLGLTEARIRPVPLEGGVPLPLYAHTSLHGFNPLAKHDLVVGTYDLPYVRAFLKVNRFDAPAEVFRQGQVDGHSVWVQYFERMQKVGMEEENGMVRAEQS